MIELGPGNGEKLATLLGASGCSAMNVHLVDVSPDALITAVRALRPSRLRSLVAHQATYEDGLAQALCDSEPASRSLVLFLGSNIGNFDPPGVDAFLHGVRAVLRSGDLLLLGADLVKPAQEMLLAYDDPLGVTAAFNRNLLVRSNRELASNFDLSGFSHQAVWNATESRIEMHLVSSRAQIVRVPAARLEISFEAGDTIWTESSYKFRPQNVRNFLDRAGFAVLDQWIADGFALTLGAAR